MKYRRFHSPEYVQYLKSEQWKTRRRAYMRVVGYRCEACGTRKKLTTHHASYQNLGHEPDWDLALCCWNCHRTIHQVDQTGKLRDLREATEWVVNRGQRRQARRRAMRALWRKLTSRRGAKSSAR